MKKLLFLSIIAIGFVGCYEGTTVKSADGDEYRVETIEGCEYIYKSSGNLGFMSHKGNCKSSFHKCKCED